MTAAAIWSSPRTVPHLPDPGLVAVMSDCPSQDSETAREAEPAGPRRLRPREPGRLAAGRPAAARPPGPHGRGGRREEPRLAHRAAAGRARRPRHVRPATSDVAHGHDVLVAAGEGGGRQPPRPRGSGRATDPGRSRRAPWPAAGRTSRASAPPGRAPARALGPGVLGEAPGLPGRATRAPPVQQRARRGAPAAGGGDARRERSRVRRHGASPPPRRGGHRPPGRPRPRRARRPRRAWRARRRTRRRARARHRRPSSPPRRRPRTQRWRRPARWPPGPGAPVARRGVDGRHEVVGHVAAYGRLHGRPRPRDDRRHEGEGASDGPAPRHLGRVATRRLRSASMSTPLARTPTTRPRSCQAGPAQQELPPART
ncbi:hypothetical protein ADJ70_07125 [Olsenella sp. oral taxon 807]|nr:hypothetical protein ADJ70_07125 [Olsenella sp. oral taxon 807]